MGGQHRADQGLIEERAQLGGVDPRFGGALEGVGQRARPRLRLHPHMGAVAADVMLVFGDVGEMREIAEGAHDRQRLGAVETVERRLQLAPGADFVVAVEADRGLANALDDFEDVGPVLLADRVAEHAAEQADVGAQRLVLLRLGGLALFAALLEGERHRRSPERTAGGPARQAPL